MNASPATVARVIANRPLPVQRPVWTTSTGDAPRVEVKRFPVEAPVRVYPEHTLSGYSDECACEKWADCYYCGACTPDE